MQGWASPERGRGVEGGGEGVGGVGEGGGADGVHGVPLTPLFALDQQQLLERTVGGVS